MVSGEAQRPRNTDARPPIVGYILQGEFVDDIAWCDGSLVDNFKGKKK